MKPSTHPISLCQFLPRTVINDHSYYGCSKCDEACKASNVEDHARNHILLDECTSMMFELCEDGRNGLYECNLAELGKHYHCKMFNCNFVISVNGSELKRLQHFKQHEDEQKESFIDDVTYSSSSSINSATDLNCSNSIGQSNSFMDTSAKSSYLASSSSLEIGNTGSLNGGNPPADSLTGYSSSKANASNKKALERTSDLNESIPNNSNQNSPNFLKEELEQFANSLLASSTSQFDSLAANAYTASLEREAGKMQKLQNCLLDGSSSLSASLLKRKRGRPPKKMEDDLVCSSKRNHLSSFFNPLPFGQDQLAGLGQSLTGNLANNLNHLDKRTADSSNVSMFLNNLLMQQNEMLDAKDCLSNMNSGLNNLNSNLNNNLNSSLNSNLNNLNNLNNNLNNMNSNLNSMGNQQAGNYPSGYPGNYQSGNQTPTNQAAFLQQRDSFLANQSSINFQMLNYIAGLNAQTPSQQTKNLVNQLINPNLNSVLHQQQQLYKNLLRQQKKAAGHNKLSD